MPRLKPNLIHVALLAAILVASLLLNVVHLGKNAYHVDETLAIFTASVPLDGLVSFLSHDAHQPAYFLALKVWIALFGHDEARTRILSSIFGVLAVFMVYLIGRSLYSGRVGLSAAAMTALSSLTLFWFRETRPYAFLVLISLISVYLLIRVLNLPSVWQGTGAVRQEPSAAGHGNSKKSGSLQNPPWRLELSYIAVSVIGVYTYNLFWLFLLAHNVAALILKKFDSRWIAAQAVIALLGVPALILFYFQLKFRFIREWWPELSIGNFAEFSISVFGNGLILLCALAIICVVIWKASFWRRIFLKNLLGTEKGRLKEKRGLKGKCGLFSWSSSDALLASLIAVPVVLCMIMILAIEKVLMPKYLIFITPLVFIFISASIFRSCRSSCLSGLVLSVLIISLIVSVPDVYSNEGWYPDARSFSAFVKDNLSEDDTLLILPFWDETSFAFYNNNDCFFKKYDYYTLEALWTCNADFGIYSTLEPNLVSDESPLTLFEDGARKNLGSVKNDIDWVVWDSYQDDSKGVIEYLNKTRDVHFITSISHLMVFRVI